MPHKGAFFMINDKPIKSINIKIPDNDNFFINFDFNIGDRWFAIVTGPNGSGKSTVLKKIKDTHSDKTILYNPKRNSIRKQLEQALQDLEVGNRKKTTLLSELGQGWEDNSKLYPSFQETIVAEFREKLNLNKDKSQKEILKEIKREYSNLIKTIFPEYKAVNWDVENTGPIFNIKKYGKHILNVDQLSTGEQEVLSLVFSVNSVKNNCKILLIDEPELHLNWSLELNLFKYLKKYSQENKIQVVVATHSRAIFDKEFKENILYIYFDSKKNITVNASAPDEVRKQIAGEAINMLVTSVDFKTIYVEDEMHKIVIEKFVNLLNPKFEINPIIAGDKQSVLSFYKKAKKNPSSSAFKNCFFMIDGDNKPDENPNDNNYLHLGKNKCIEAYFLDFKILSKITNKKIKTIKNKFCKLINKVKKDKSNDHPLYLGDITPRLITAKFISKFEPKDIWIKFYKYLGYKNEEKFIEDFLHYLAKINKLRSKFDLKLTKLFEV